jgi:tRNA (guanine37-N1)-methyltransferase
MFESVLSSSILGRAVEAGHLEIELINIRDYSQNKHKNTDDYPFGGGAGMVMTAQPIVDAFAANLSEPWSGRRIYLSPRGRTLDQHIVEELAKEEELALLCGHYEGVDQRALDAVIDEELSIGDYVLTGGELPACILIDSVSRLIDGVLADASCHEEESVACGMLEYPQYTRPIEYRGLRVPDVLTSGDHAKIKKWRFDAALKLTEKNRPDMLGK